MSTKGIIRFGVFTMCFAAAVGGMCGMFARNVIQLRRMNDA